MSDERLDGIFAMFFDTEIAQDQNIFELGANSLTAVRLIQEVNSAFCRDIDMERFFLSPCKQTLIDELNNSQSPGLS